MSCHNRRKFLQQAAAGGIAATFALSGTKSSGRVLGANDRVRVAVAGVNGRGQGHIRNFATMKDVEIAYLVDPDSRLFDSRAKLVARLTGATPRCVQDFRRVLDDKSLDAVSLATPNHWHALQAIWACQAGKDAYVEKPCSHNIVEGRKLVEAARKYNRMVQHGTQRRSDPQWVQLTNDLHRGKYGKLLVSYAYCSQRRLSIGFKEPEEPPREVDFNLWLGPAAKRPFHRNLVHYNWHWMWDFGNGEIGNMGSHQLDVCRWALPVGALPKSVVSIGGRYGYQDQAQTPNTNFVVFDFGEAKLFLEDRGLVTREQVKITAEFYTDEGVIRDGKFFPKGKGEGLPIAAAPVPGVPEQGPCHFRNFIDCVRSRKREDLHADILEGHRTMLLVHLGNLSYRLGEDVSFQRQPEAFAGDQLACASFEAMKRHLVDAAHLDLNQATYRLGRTLRFDPQAERFLGDPEADRLLTRPYRQPFVVPQQV
jgi:predicted dehydrogenase